MASDVGIVNLALTLLGSSRIISLGDDTKPAREANAIYAITRDSLLAKYNWSFAKTRTELSPDATPPQFGFANRFLLPSDCLRLLLVNEQYAGFDLTNYRGVPTEQYTIEGRYILAEWNGPLPLRYIRQVVDSGLFPPVFVEMFGCQLAMDLCEPLTQSAGKWQKASVRFQQALRDAIRTNAIELPPNKLADDEWIMSRL